MKVEPVVEHIKVLPYPLDTVDVALALVFRDTFDTRHKRTEELPGKLIIYQVIDERRKRCLGECGEIRIQFLSFAQARLSIEVYPCFEEDVFRFYEPSSRTSARLAYAQWDSELRPMRKEFLNDLCSRLIKDLEACGPVHSDIKLPPANQAGKPELELEEATLRISLAMLEKHLKAQDAGMTRGEVVVLAQERLAILTTINNIKDGIRRLKDAEWENDESLLAAARDQLQAWLARLAF
ncbi:MAG: hypothetical protein WC541_10205 [Dehalococcoidia bacterium]